MVFYSVKRTCQQNDDASKAEINETSLLINKTKRKTWTTALSKVHGNFVKMRTPSGSCRTQLQGSNILNSPGILCASPGNGNVELLYTMTVSSLGCATTYVSSSISAMLFKLDLWHLIGQWLYMSSIVEPLNSLVPQEGPRRLSEENLVFMIPQRYILGIMGFLAVVNAYVMRVILSVAITEMVETKKIEHYDSTSCAFYLTNSTGHHKVSTLVYPWTSTQQGLILSSFYWGYVITHIPGGMIAERFGGKYSLGLGILCTAIFTFITPFVIYATDGNWVWVVILRVVEGLGEGTTFPALTTLLAHWVPAGERSKIGTLVYAGSQIGTVVGNSVSGAIIAATHNWANVFYVFGIIGIVWVILFMMLCYADPDSHPFISDKEKIFLGEEIVNISAEHKLIPWRSILTSPPIWALVVAQIGHDWGFFTMVTDLPKYMAEVLHFDVKENGLWSSIPYVFMWIVSMSSGWICDWIIHKGHLTITGARKFFTTIASLGPAIFIMIAVYSGCDRVQAVSMFTIGMGFMGTFYCGMKVNALDLAPNFAGTIMAIVNGIGALTGIIVPYLVGALTENHTFYEWKIVFWISFGVFLATNMIFILLGSAEIQPWNDNQHKKSLEMVQSEPPSQKVNLETMKTKL